MTKVKVLCAHANMNQRFHDKLRLSNTVLARPTIETLGSTCIQIIGIKDFHDTPINY